jgi:hypothetical protein
LADQCVEWQEYEAISPLIGGSCRAASLQFMLALAIMVLARRQLTSQPCKLHWLQLLGVWMREEAALMP